MSGVKRIEEMMAAQSRKKEGREDSHERHPTFSVRLEFADGNSKSMLYGTLLSGFYFNPSYGIQCIFEGAYAHGWGNWQYDVWEVSITGHDLEPIFEQLCASKELFIRESEDAEGKVAKIEVKVAKVLGYPPEKK